MIFMPFMSFMVTMVLLILTYTFNLTSAEVTGTVFRVKRRQLGDKQAH
jgi:hypothetical protein